MTATKLRTDTRCTELSFVPAPNDPALATYENPDGVPFRISFDLRAVGDWWIIGVTYGQRKDGIEVQIEWSKKPPVFTI